MDERKPFRRGQDDGPAGLDRAEWSVTEAKTPVPKKARQPAVWLIPAAAGAVLLLTVGILLVRRGTPPPIPPASSPASDQEVLSGPSSASSSSTPQEPWQDENGFWDLPDSRVTPLAYKGPFNSLELVRDGAVEETVTLDLQDFGYMSDYKVKTFVLGQERYLASFTDVWDRPIKHSISSDQKSACLWFGWSLFMYNSADGTVQKISRDQVGGYDMEKLEELQNTEDAPTDVGQLHWIINPTPSEDNSLVAYQSNRRTYEDFVRRYREDGEKEGFRIGLYLEDDIWYIDMATGEESLLVEDAAAIVWAGRTLIYSRDTDDTLWKIDVDTKKIESFTPGNQTVSWPRPIDRQGRFLVGKKPVVDGVAKLAIWDSRTDTLTEWDPGPQISGLSQFRDWVFMDGSDTAMALYHIDLNVPHDKWRENLDFVVVTDGKGGQTVYTLPLFVRNQGESVVIEKVLSETRLIISLSETSKQEFQFAEVDLSLPD